MAHNVYERHNKNATKNTNINVSQLCYQILMKSNYRWRLTCFQEWAKTLIDQNHHSIYIAKAKAVTSLEKYCVIFQFIIHLLVRNQPCKISIKSSIERHYKLFWEKSNKSLRRLCCPKKRREVYSNIQYFRTID